MLSSFLESLLAVDSIMSDPSSNPLGMTAENYHALRTQRRGWLYRRRRRAEQVLEAISRCSAKVDFDRVPDVGVADGLTFGSIENELRVGKTVGIDLPLALMRFTRTDDDLTCIQADAVDLPFRDGHFDLITATAVIEHVNSIPRFLNELYRVLKPGGLVVVTTPDPDGLAGRLLPIFDEVHVETLTLARLERYFTDAGFAFRYGEKFMLSPIGFPLERKIEATLRRLRLTFTMLNQVAVAVKPDLAYDTDSDN